MATCTVKLLQTPNQTLQLANRTAIRYSDAEKFTISALFDIFNKTDKYIIRVLLFKLIIGKFHPFCISYFTLIDAKKWYIKVV